MDCTVLAQDRNNWRVLVSAVMNIRHKLWTISWLHMDLLDFHESSMELVSYINVSVIPTAIFRIVKSLVCEKGIQNHLFGEQPQRLKLGTIFLIQPIQKHGRI